MKTSLSGVNTMFGAFGCYFISKEHLLYNDALFQIKAHGGKVKGFEREPVFYSKEIMIMVATEQCVK